MAAARLLVVTAHPDDEVLHFGGLIHLTAHAGGHVTLVCATRGEVGEIADPTLATPETLGAVREAELHASAALLRVADVRLLDYRDSGMADTADNHAPRAFVRAPADEVVATLVRVIREVRPAIVATWAPDGGYGHPDHVAASRHATAAVDLAAQPHAAELGAPWAAEALYYAARPAALREEVRAFMAARGQASAPAARPARPAPEPLPVSVALDVGAALAVKKAARAAHRTQTRPDSWVAALPPDLERRFTGTEYFHRARPTWQAGQPDDLLERLLGLPVRAPTA
ncbi:MAG TPA: PIG-L family deacetylase [Chloroflexota bacterium]|nr:PIG-L family deacetylase [Chloroflexota bacterium]